MRDAGAILAKASFPFTVTCDHETVRRRMRYFEDKSKFSLPIIEVECELVPHQFPIKKEEVKEFISDDKISEQK